MEKKRRGEEKRGASTTKRKAKAKDGDDETAVPPDPGDCLEDVDVLAKRPDPAAGAAVIVLHPGSTNLRVGLASSPAPRVIPHCIAFRRVIKHAQAAPCAVAVEAVVHTLEPALALLARQLRLGVQLVGHAHLPVAPTARLCDSGESCAVSSEADQEVNEVAHAQFLVGEAALSAALKAPSEWDVLHPIQSGVLNLGAGTNPTSDAANCTVVSTWCPDACLLLSHVPRGLQAFQSEACSLRCIRYGSARYAAAVASPASG